VIDVRDDAEVARVLDTHEARKLCGRSESSTSAAGDFDWSRVAEDAGLGCRGQEPRLPRSWQLPSYSYNKSKCRS
jgi:hypothetical protein